MSSSKKFHNDGKSIKIKSLIEAQKSQGTSPTNNMHGLVIKDFITQGLNKNPKASSRSQIIIEDEEVKSENSGDKTNAYF